MVYVLRTEQYDCYQIDILGVFPDLDAALSFMIVSEQKMWNENRDGYIEWLEENDLIDSPIYHQQYLNERMEELNGAIESWQTAMATPEPANPFLFSKWIVKRSGIDVGHQKYVFSNVKSY